MKKEILSELTRTLDEHVLEHDEAVRFDEIEGEWGFTPSSHTTYSVKNFKGTAIFINSGFVVVGSCTSYSSYGNQSWASKFSVELDDSSDIFTMRYTTPGASAEVFREIRIPNATKPDSPVRIRYDIANKTAVYFLLKDIPAATNANKVLSFSRNSYMKIE